MGSGICGETDACAKRIRHRARRFGSMLGMSILANGRSTACLRCGYAPLADGEAMRMGELVEALQNVPAGWSLTIEPGTFPLAVHDYPPNNVAFCFEMAPGHVETGRVLSVGEWLDDLQRRRFPSGSLVWLGEIRQRGEFGYLKVVGVRETGRGAVSMVLADHETRNPICVMCGMFGRVQPDHLTLGELLQQLGSVPWDAPVKTDVGTTPTEVACYDDRNYYLTVLGNLKIVCEPGDSRESGTVGELLEKLWTANGSVMKEDYSGTLTVIDAASPVWCDRSPVAGVERRNGQVELVTSRDLRWMFPSFPNDTVPYPQDRAFADLYL